MLFWLPFTRSTCYTRSSQAHSLALYALAACITLTPKTNNCYFLVRDQAGTMSLLELRPVIIEALSLS